MDMIVSLIKVQEMNTTGWGEELRAWYGSVTGCGHTRLTQVYQTLVYQILNSVPQSGASIGLMSRPLMISTV